MSDDRDLSADSVSPVDVDRVSSEDVLETVRDYYHVPVLLAIVGAMMWIRAQAAENFRVDGQIYFGGNDPWYHLRQVEYTVQNWPAVMPFEVWTGFAQGNLVGQFGTLYDQLMATAALIVGLGNPTPEQIQLVVLYSPVVFGSLVAIPTYLIGARLGGRLGGLFGVVILALLPGTFLQRGLVGFADHHVVEVFFQSLAVVGLMIAIAIARREWPVLEQLRDVDAEGLRRVAGWSTVAGVLTALYLYTWPPGIMLVGIVGMFFLIVAMSDVISGRSPEHIGIVGVISMAITGILLLVPIDTLGFGVSDFTILQPLLAFAVAGGSLFLALLGRAWDERDLDDRLYPVAVLAILIVGMALVALLIPRLWGLLESNLLRFVGFDAAASQRTIGEAQPFPSSRASQLGLSGPQVIFLEYGAAFFTALAAGAWMVLRPHLAKGDLMRLVAVAAGTAIAVIFVAFPVVPDAIGEIFLVEGSLVGIVVVGSFLGALMVLGEYDAEELFVLVWSVFILSAAFTQIRFNYYLVVPVAVLNAYLLGEVIRVLGVDWSIADPRSIEISHVLVVATILVLVIAPLVAPISFANQNGENVPMQTAWETGQNNPPGDVTRWDGTLQWMANETPEEGNYGGANNADQMDYYGAYPLPPDGDFDYPEGAYGVMSWWDYGHWITVRGERIPNANPFQQHATQAANYLLAPNESTAESHLDEYDEDDAKTRYVVVDWKMVEPGSKFGAPIVFYDENESLSNSDMIRGQIYNPEQGTWLNLKTQRYYESQMVRLYRYHGSAKQAQPIVVTFEQRTFETQDGGEVQVPAYNGTQQFQSMDEAHEFADRSPNAMVGGISDVPAEDVPALQHYRLVAVSGQHLAPANYIQGGEFNFGNHPTWLKVFERVPGATVEGTAPPNTTVTARAELAIPFPEQPGTFNYTQHAEVGPDGEFEMTLPYSTTGYENWGPEEGYTNVSVRATGPYTFSTPTDVDEDTTITRWETNASVPEATVIGEDPEPVQVSLEERELGELPDGNETDGNETDGNETDGDEPIGNETTTNETVGGEPTDDESISDDTTVNETGTETGSVGSEDLQSVDDSELRETDERVKQDDSESASSVAGSARIP
ncbi:MAG: oligosaccharyl transferase, archaeosortase A system-associated [Halodesulfurarchaeum sp.]